ncbi:hypothetical protein MUO32_29135 [Shinella sp. CPCC 101442]|nr:hypothetical protein [Shinella sp. CPCC 101442]MCR6503081.1 hypothetical protein [Shinella sp. CPCC 101442]
MSTIRHPARSSFGELTQTRNEGGLWDESEKLYPDLSANPRSAPDLLS